MSVPYGGGYGCIQCVFDRRRRRCHDGRNRGGKRLATPPDVAAEPSARNVELAAAITPPADAITIPIIDIGPTPGPLSILRQLSVLVGLDPLTAGLIQDAGNTYNLPGLDTLYELTQ